MLRKKAINDFITACENIGLSDTAILNKLVDFVTNATMDPRLSIPQIKILEEGEVVRP